MKFALLIGLALTVQGCGPTGKEKVGPEASHREPMSDAGNVSQDADAIPQLGDAECEALFAHVFQIAFESQREELPAEQRPTEDDLRRAKDALRVELFGMCVGATRESFQFDCAMAATTPAELQRCMGAE